MNTIAQYLLTHALAAAVQEAQTELDAKAPEAIQAVKSWIENELDDLEAHLTGMRVSAAAQSDKIVAAEETALEASPAAAVVAPVVVAPPVVGTNVKIH